VRERPIIMHAESVRAILAGRKTQTRRVVTPQPVGLTSPWRGANLSVGGRDHRCPYGAPGERLWCRETWMCDEYGRRHQSAGMVHYRADAESMGAWRSPLFMPRWASRLTLEVVDVRVERVWDITPLDAYAEGCGCDECVVCNGTGDYDGAACGECDGEGRIRERANYRRLWDALNAKRGYPWASGPWVWVVEFRRVES